MEMKIKIKINYEDEDEDEAEDKMKMKMQKKMNNDILNFTRLLMQNSHSSLRSSFSTNISTGFPH